MSTHFTDSGLAFNVTGPVSASDYPETADKSECYAVSFEGHHLGVMQAECGGSWRDEDGIRGCLDAFKVVLEAIDPGNAHSLEEVDALLRDI